MKTCDRPAVIEGNTAKIPLGVDAKHGYAIVDKEFAYLDKYYWTIKKHKTVSYAVSVMGEKGNMTKMQWLILPKKSNKLIDHQNGNGLDNRKENLRYVTKQQNQFNQGINSKNTSGFKGVSFRKDIKKWGVRLRHHGKYISLGAYATPTLAAEVYNKFVLEHRGEYAKVNVI